MRIKIEFTVEVPDVSLKALKNLAVADTTAHVRDFVKNEAEEYLLQYMDSNGVGGVTVVHRK